MTDLGKLMQQAQAMQARMLEAQERVANAEAEGRAGAGLVTVRLKGKGELVGLQLDPSLVAEGAEVIEDLIKAAHADARRRLDEAVEAAMREATAGFGGLMPGFKLPF